MGITIREIDRDFGIRPPHSVSLSVRVDFQVWPEEVEEFKAMLALYEPRAAMDSLLEYRHWIATTIDP